MSWSRHCLFAAALIAAANNSSGATQGELGRESTATNRITLIIHPSLQITDVDDITINVSQRDKDAVHTEEVCVRGNSGASYFVVAQTGKAAGPKFLLRNDDAQSLAFEVRYRSNLNSAAGEPLQPNIQSRLQSSTPAGGSCEGGNVAAFDLKFPADQLSAAKPGVYTGLLTLTVVAE